MGLWELMRISPLLSTSFLVLFLTRFHPPETTIFSSLSLSLLFLCIPGGHKHTGSFFLCTNGYIFFPLFLLTSTLYWYFFNYFPFHFLALLFFFFLFRSQRYQVWLTIVFFVSYFQQLYSYCSLLFFLQFFSIFRRPFFYSFFIFVVV